MVENNRRIGQLRAEALNAAQSYGPLTQPKLDVLDYAFSQFKVSSFADLGAAYRVDGGYTLYSFDVCGAKKGVLVDTHPTAKTLIEVGARPGAEVVRGNFGDREIAARVDQVDAVIFFDVLLHQVAPNWDQLLELYSAQTRLFIIHNPQWLGPETIRLLDLGEEKYLSSIPKTRNETVYRSALDRPDEVLPEHGRPNRDVHHIWQWGITDASLISKLDRLGFALRYFKDHGYFWNLDRFRNHSFIFEKTVDAAAK
ncbi:MAG: hypothetical protein ACR2G0_08810 [Chthoniobacterales bacterium]